MVEGLHILAEASGTVWVEMDGLSAEEEHSENGITHYVYPLQFNKIHHEQIKTCVFNNGTGQQMICWYILVYS